MARLLLYGAYGYTGGLIAEAAVERGLDPVLAGRREDPLADQADELDCDYRVFGLEDKSARREAVADCEAVLNCAGPFAETYEPLVESCLETGTHYLDITGELDVFQGLAADDDAAAEADVTLLPGVGFDVVPTDCLAAHLAGRLPSATHLALGFDAMDGVSPGTAKTALRYLGESAYVRHDGRLEAVPPAHETRRIDFGRGPRTATTFPWGDLVTAYHTTGIPNVEVYAAVPPAAVWALRSSRFFGPVLGSEPVRETLETVVDWTVEGPDARTRDRGRSYLWGEAIDEGAGERVVSRIETLETYALTVETALETAERVLAGEAPAGFQTPAGAIGPDLVLDVPETTREDVE